MISWLAVNASFILLLVGFLAVALLVGWWINRKTWYLFALAPVALIALAVGLVSIFYVTDQRRLRQTVEEMADAIEKRKLDGFFKHVSESFQHRLRNKAAFRELVDQRTRQHQLTQFSVSGFDFGEVSRTTRKGEIDFFIHARGNWGEPLPLRCFAEFVLEGDNWRLKGFRLTLGNTGQEFHIP